MINPIRPLLQRTSAAIMGILNITPDSFSDGGEFNSAEAAFLHALEVIEQGADIIDVGGESTRPGAEEVSLQQELDRVIPVIERLSKERATPISVDTSKPAVMTAAIDAGASMINDVNGLRARGAIQAVAQAGVPVCIMHMQGQPETMQNAPAYDNVVDEVLTFLKTQIELSVAGGISRDDIIIDPGIGFGKTLQHNLALLRSISQLHTKTGSEVLVGISRKSMIDRLLKRAVNERLAASLGLAVQAILNGAKLVRVHDVRATYDAIRAVEAVQND